MPTYSRSFIFQFEELALLIDLGFKAGLVSGRAEISYTSNVYDYTITGLWLDGFKEAERTEEEKLLARLKGKPLSPYVEKLVPVESGSWLDTTICSRLYEEWCHEVQEAIRDQLEDGRCSVVSNIADYRRDQQMVGRIMAEG